MKRQEGFSLIELMIAAIILAILIATSVPAYNSLFGRKTISAVGKGFERSLQLARTEAVQRSTNVRVLPVIAGNNWAQGWRIEFTNAGGNIELIRQFDALPNNPQFTSNDFSMAAPLTFEPNGQASDQGSFELRYANCDTHDEIITYNILLSGLVRRTVGACI